MQLCCKKLPLTLYPFPMRNIHISTLRSMLRAGEPVDLKLWTKSGETCD